MKKILIRLVVVVVVLIALAVLGISLFLDSAIKGGVEKFGPQMTQTAVTLDAANISPFSGSGTLKGLAVGNPEGFKTTNAITLGSATLALKPMSVFGEKVIVHQIEVLEPHITFELNMGGNNISKLLANLEEATGGSDTNAAAEPNDGPNRKLQVDDFVIRGAKVNLTVSAMGGRVVPVTLPDIHLTELGTGPEGITATELVKRVLKELEREGMKAVQANMSQLGDVAAGLTRDIESRAGGAVSNLTGGTVTNISGGLRDLIRRNNR